MEVPDNIAGAFDPAFAGADPSPVNIPDHDLIRRIGVGAFGEVWIARNAVGTFRAVKIVRRRDFEREENYEREFKGLQRFEPISRSHHGFVDVLHLGRNDKAGYFFYVMELAEAFLDPGSSILDSGSFIPQPSPVSSIRHPVSGNEHPASTIVPSTYVPHTLREDLKRGGGLPLADCLSIALKLCAALEHLHSQGLVHRDIKPSNIIFVNGEPKLADIGLVAAIGDAQSLVGTVGYIPPEGPGTVQADLYSLGKVLYEMALGKDRQDFPQLPPDLSQHADYAQLLELNEIILKACDTDRNKRYRTAKEMGDDLTLLQDGQSVRRQRLRKRNWERIRILALATLATAVVTSGFLFLNASRTGYRPKPEALQLYTDGQWQYSELTPESHVKAHDLLTRAVQADPRFVQPYGPLVALYTWNDLPGITNEQIRLQKVLEIADKASAIDPDSAERHLASSWARFLQKDWHGAEDEIKSAIRVNPDFAHAHEFYCFYLSMQGRIKEAHREGQQAVKLRRLEPWSKRASAIIASWPYIAERRFDRAIVQLQSVQDSKFTYGLSFLAECYVSQTNYVKAIDTWKASALTLYAGDSERVLAIFRELREAYDTLGWEGYLRKWIELMVAEQSLPDEKRMLNDMVGPSLAGAYARLGETVKALKELEDHFNEPQIWHQLKFLPEYDSLHGESRFKALVKQAGLEP